MVELLRNARHALTLSTSRNDENRLDCHANPCGLSRNDDSITPSLRGSEATEAIHLQIYKPKKQQNHKEIP